MKGLPVRDPLEVSFWRRVIRFNHWMKSVWIPSFGDWWAGLDIWAPRGARFLGDVTGPSVYSAPGDVWWRVSRTVLATFLFVVFIWRLYDTQRDKTSRGFSSIFGDELPLDLPGSIDSTTLQHLSPPERDAVGPRGRALPITSGLFCNRLRRRARWVRALEVVLGGRNGLVGKFVRGRWIPDLPTSCRPTSYAYLTGSLKNGVRCLGGGTVRGEVRSSDGETKEPRSVVYLVLDDGDNVQLCAPELLARLRLYALFRERDEQLVGALRTRANRWCKDLNLDPRWSDLLVGPTIGFAMSPSTHEELATRNVVQAMGTTSVITGL